MARRPSLVRPSPWKLLIDVARRKRARQRLYRPPGAVPAARLAGEGHTLSDVNLLATEIRVLGCLLEKQHTTPDAYPLSLNALRLACNQSTNRDPVVAYDDAVIRDALDRLYRRGYTRLSSGAGSRTAKYRHLLAEALPMGEDEQAVMCVLMLRGPQTPGELKQRTERMYAFGDLAGVQATLGQLIERGLVSSLGRRPGQKEERYTQLLEDPEAQSTVASAPSIPRELRTAPREAPQPIGSFAAPTGGLAALAERVDRLERQLAELIASRSVEAAPLPEDAPDAGTGSFPDDDPDASAGSFLEDDRDASPGSFPPAQTDWDPDQP
jgi:uncharacterized protein YceH (UPF0502 family)